MSTAVVLIVEKDREIRRVLREGVEGPYEVLEATSLREAREKVETPPCPDLVLSDLRATDPGQGLALCRRLWADPSLDARPVLLVVPPDRAGALFAEIGGPQALRRVVGHHLAAEGCVPGAPLVPDAPLAEKVEAVVEARLGDPTFTAGDLAETVDLSARQLTRRMKEDMGATPAAYIRTRRLGRAKELLDAGPETVKKVAGAVGFSSPSAFAKAFREHVGIPPSAYAERHEK